MQSILAILLYCNTIVLYIFSDLFIKKESQLPETMTFKDGAPTFSRELYLTNQISAHICLRQCGGRERTTGRIWNREFSPSIPPPESGTSLHMRGERRRTRRRGRYRIRVKGEGGGERKRAAARTRCHSFPAHNAYRHNAWFYAIVCAAHGTSVCIGLHACRTNTCVRAYGLSDSHLFRSRFRHARVSILFSLSLVLDGPAFSSHRSRWCVCLPQKYTFLTLESKCQIIFNQRLAIAPRGE